METVEKAWEVFLSSQPITPSTTEASIKHEKHIFYTSYASAMYAAVNIIMTNTNDHGLNNQKAQQDFIDLLTETEDYLNNR